MRLVRVGNKNWAVTETVAKVTSAFDCKPVEGDSLLHFPVKICTYWQLLSGMLSCQQTQNVIDGKKRIILNPVRKAASTHQEKSNTFFSVVGRTEARVRDCYLCRGRGLGHRHPRFFWRRWQGEPSYCLLRAWS